MFRKIILFCGLLSLAGCLDLGGGGGSNSKKKPPVTTTESSQTSPSLNSEEPGHPVAPPLQPPTTPPANNFPEPAAAVTDEVNALGFYDKTADGQPRFVRNDLSGTFAAMLQFVQSHSVDPQNNEAKNMPRLTSEREALLLVTPDPDQTFPKLVRVRVLVDGSFKGELVLRHPDEIYRADRYSIDARPDVVYTRRAWSGVLPWDWVVPGMSLQISDDQGRRGERSADAFDFAPPAELLVQSIRIGMLTPPKPTENHWFINQAVRATTEYFQTVPISRMVAGQYEDVYLRRVMVANGTIYDADLGQVSPGSGDVYGGDMRSDTAKATFSIGINLANWGMTSSSMTSQEQPQLTNSAVMHHAVGAYSNGIVTHGLSGGNGILTLINSVGNEFSHEIGHHYGLGHYPGQNGASYFWAGHHHDSGWGYIAYRKRMRANLHWTRDKTAGLDGMPIYADAYSFATDPMAGGAYTNLLSQYPIYTGYSTKLKIQPALDRAVWAADSATGYRKWNAVTRKMEVFQPKVPASNDVWYNSPDGNYRKPRLFGVPVFTLLGGYDPVTNAAVLYPALRGNWGQVFDLPSPNDTDSGKQCWVLVGFASGANQRIAVAHRRLGSNANKLHINLAQSEQPVAASLQCRNKSGDASIDLASVNIPQGLPAMAPAVVVGREERFNALRELELPKLQIALEAVSRQSLPVLQGEARLLYESYSDEPEGLSSSAQQVMQRLNNQQLSARRLNRWLDAYGSQLMSNREAGDAFHALLADLQLTSSPLLPPAQVFISNSGDCVGVEQVGGGWKPYLATKSQCTGATEEKWLVDATGRIRSLAQPLQCLTATGEVSLSTCDSQNESQAWSFVENQQLKYGGRCLDAPAAKQANGRGKLIMYNCHGGTNQQWSGLALNDNSLLPLLQNRNLASFMSYAKLRSSSTSR